MAQAQEEKQVNDQELTFISALDPDFVDAEINDRVFVCALSEIACQLAQQAGEEVKRPLSRAQLARAFDVNTEERRIVLALCTERWQRLDQEGKLPPQAYFAGPDESLAEPHE